ncbi:MAG: Trp operon repressor [Flavobacteriales bacterium]|jgi:Trp operon repressor
MKNLFALLKSMDEKEFNRFMEITFTENERIMIEERWRIFLGLENGLSQREVAKDIPCSVVTVTRGAKTYRKFKNIISRFLVLLFNEE